MSEHTVSKLAGCAALLALVAQPGAAMADAARGPATDGAADPAVINCKLMTNMHEASVTGTERQFFNYAQGYFSGRSSQLPAASQRQLAPAGVERVKQFGALLKHCEKNPEATFADAVLALWSSLQTPAG